jgi:hypothetical protein
MPRAWVRRVLSCEARDCDVNIVNVLGAAGADVLVGHGQANSLTGTAVGTS